MKKNETLHRDIKNEKKISDSIPISFVFIYREWLCCCRSSTWRSSFRSSSTNSVKGSILRTVGLWDSRSTVRHTIVCFYRHHAPGELTSRRWQKQKSPMEQVDWRHRDESQWNLDGPCRDLFGFAPYYAALTKITWRQMQQVPCWFS